MKWPENKKFAFTIFDDTDNAKLEDVKLVYDFLFELNIKTTKSVWVIDPISSPRIGGENLSNKDYLSYVKLMSDRGFEIAFHNASASHNERKSTQDSFELFKNYFSKYPKSFANHADNKENIYWGEKRISGLYKLLFGLKNKSQFQGENCHSKYFWGDICKKHLEYVRNFVFQDVNTLKADPYMPYYDPNKPFVNNWFSSSDGGNINSFLNLVSKNNVDRLEKENGCCIVYTHFCSFVKNGELNPEFMETMKYLNSKDGWFVPVNTLLDYLKEKQGNRRISYWKKKRLETIWLLDKVKKHLK